MIKPINNNILIEIEKELNNKGLLIMQSNKSDIKTGIVVSINLWEDELKINDKVIFNINDGVNINNNNIDFIIIDREKIMAKVEEGEE